MFLEALHKADYEIALTIIRNSDKRNRRRGEHLCELYAKVCQSQKVRD